MDVRYLVSSWEPHLHLDQTPFLSSLPSHRRTVLLIHSGQQEDPHKARTRARIPAYSRFHLLQAFLRQIRGAMVERSTLRDQT